jgi:serine/threonine-protein kinase
MSRERESDRQVVQDVFEAALKVDPDVRAAFLETACAGRDALRAEVQSLLDAHEADGPVDRALNELAPFHRPIEDTAIQGRRIGPYELMEELGHGGMGRVFLARRADGQFDRQVALKLLGTSIPSPETQNRFLAERQILAQLNHPNIARLLDGGVSAAGQPYFVMEVVHGRPIDQYCATHRCSFRERLRLVLDVCDAVQYAHQQLVVHRDLKPANVLVSDDGTVKLLDFGIAKLLDPGALPSSDVPRTRTGRRLMTPAYASPEQVRGEAITTASDVYQLGVLLYEVLTGRRPYRVEGRSPSEVERVICEETPPRPSTAATRTADTKDDPEIPPCRPSALRGDLDVIVMTALRKEPERRYDAVEQLAEDLRRALVGRPVSAHPNSWTYRSRKFLDRHRWGVGVAALVAVLLIGYAATITWQSQRTQAALNRAQEEAQKSEQVTAFLVDLFRANDPQESAGGSLTARTLLKRGVKRAERLDDQPEIQAELFDVVGQVYGRLGRYDDAQTFLERSVTTRRRLNEEPSPDVAATRVRIASMLRKSGDYEAAETRFRDALQEQKQLLGSEHPDVAVTQSLLAGTLRTHGELDEAERRLREALAIQRRHPEADTLDRARTLNILGLVLRDRSEPTEAETALRDALDLRRRHLGKHDPRVARSLNNLAMLLRQQGNPEAAVPVYREALAVKRALYDNPHPSTAATLSGLGLALQDQGDVEAAEPLLRKALEMRRATLGPNHPRTAGSLNNLGNLLEDQGRLKEAASHLREARTRLQSTLGKTHPFVAYPSTGLGRIYMKQGRPADAEPFLREVVSIREDALPPHHPERVRGELMLGSCLTDLGRYEDAESLLVDVHERLSRKGTDDSSDLMEETDRHLRTLYEAWEKPDRRQEITAGRGPNADSLP